MTICRACAVCSVFPGCRTDPWRICQPSDQRHARRISDQSGAALVRGVHDRPGVARRTQTSWLRRQSHRILARSGTPSASVGAIAKRRARSIGLKCSSGPCMTALVSNYFMPECILFGQVRKHRVEDDPPRVKQSLPAINGRIHTIPRAPSGAGRIRAKRRCRHRSPAGAEP
jgi:hypothetical protein